MALKFTDLDLPKTKRTLAMLVFFFNNYFANTQHNRIFARITQYTLTIKTQTKWETHVVCCKMAQV